MSTGKKENTKSEKGNHQPAGFAFEKQNYILMVAGVLVILAGFLLMSGGKAENPTEFNPEIFSTRRIIIAPMVVLAGFVIEVFAIFRTPKN